MDGDSAQGIEDNENNRHDAGVRISHPVEDLVGVVIPLLIDVSRITLVMSLLTEDHLRRLIVGQTELLPSLAGRLTKCQDERCEREGMKLHHVWICWLVKVSEIRTGELEGEKLMALVCEAVDLLAAFFGFRLFNGPNHETLKLELRDVETKNHLGSLFDPCPSGYCGIRHKYC